ncbi:hypothetical protein [Labrys neptuniae]
MALVLLIASAVYYLFYVFWQANPSVQSAIIAGGFAVLAVLITYWRERRKSLQEAHREKKIEVYSEFYDIIFDMMKRSKIGDGVEEFDDTELHEKFMNISRGVMFYGSSDVVLAFSNWKLEDISSSRPTHAMRSIGQILLAMRKDIGLSNRGIDSLTIHQVYVNDDIRKLEAGT